MSFTHYPVEYGHQDFLFNEHLNSDGSERQAYLQNSVVIEEAVENPVFRDLRDPYHLTQGGQLGRVHKGMRVVELRGTIIVPEDVRPPQSNSIEDKVRQMRAAFDPSVCYRDSPSTDGAYALQFTSGTSDIDVVPSRRISMIYYARPVGQPYIAESVLQLGRRPFRIPLLMGDPRAYNGAETLLVLSSGTPSGTMTNLGNTAAPLAVDIVMAGAGSATFTITRSSVAFILDLSGCAALDAVRVVMETCGPYGRGRYITKNTVEHAELKTSAAHTWLDVPVGAVAVALSNTTNITSCTLRWHDAWT